MADGKAQHKFDLFVSFAKEDGNWVRGYLLDAFEKSGIVYHTEEEFEPGTPYLVALEAAIRQSKRTVLVFSPDYLRKDLNSFIDVLVQHYGLETGTWSVIPLILQPVELPTRLGMLNRIEALDQADWESVVDRLIETLGRPLPGATTVPPPPYPGMRTFQQEESNLFFGRDREVEELAKLLRSNAFVMLIGPSGSGKSSLVRAGLIPALQAKQSLGTGKWVVRELRPGERPFDSLSNALGGDPSQPEITVSALLSTQSDSQRLIVFVDQFEELFTVAREDTDSFQEALVNLSKHPQTYIVLTVRADFYHELMVTPIWDTLQKYRYEILPLDEEGLKQAVAKPAESAGVYIEPALVERLVSDAGEEPGILPFVQETMILLWDKVERRYLPLSAYETLVLPRNAYDETQGTLTGLKATIAIHADAVLKRLTEKQRVIVRRIFVRLVQFGEGYPDTRRQQSESMLRSVTDESDLFDLTLAYLADHDQRLLTLHGDDVERKVDIVHEALITAWPALHNWIDEWREDEIIRRQLENDAMRWFQEHQNDSYLYQGMRLSQSQAWAINHDGEISEACRIFLDVGQRHEIKRKRYRQVFLVLIGLFALSILGGGLYLLYQENLRQSAKGDIVRFETAFAELGTSIDADHRSYQTEKVRVPAFSLEKHEVTNRRYHLCVQAGVCSNEPLLDVSDDNLPVVNVTAYQAAQFCQWIGRRLPTEMEWERAARGIEGRNWPWEGDGIPTPSHANVRIQTDPGERPNSSKGMLAAVDDPAYSAGVTPEGVTHLLGNALEWTSTPGACEQTPYSCSTLWDGQSKVTALFRRGLSFNDLIDAHELAADDPKVLVKALVTQPDHTEPDTGFRCAFN